MFFFSCRQSRPFKPSLYIRLTLNPLTWKIWWAPNNVSRWQIGFNLAFKGLRWTQADTAPVHKPHTHSSRNVSAKSSPVCWEQLTTVPQPTFFSTDDASPCLFYSIHGFSLQVYFLLTSLYLLRSCSLFCPLFATFSVLDGCFLPQAHFWKELILSVSFWELFLFIEAPVCRLPSGVITRSAGQPGSVQSNILGQTSASKCQDSPMFQELILLRYKNQFIGSWRGPCGPNFTSPHRLAPCSRVLLEKLTGSQLVKKFPSFYVTRRFITAFTSARHVSLSWASSIQSIPPHTSSWRSILILSSHLRLGLPSGLFPSGFPHQNPVYASLLSHTCYMPHPSHSSRFGHPNTIVWAVQIIKLLIM